MENTRNLFTSFQTPKSKKNIKKETLEEMSMKWIY
jgi:hypothetical protein